MMKGSKEGILYILSLIIFQCFSQKTILTLILKIFIYLHSSVFNIFITFPLKIMTTSVHEPPSPLNIESTSHHNTLSSNLMEVLDTNTNYNTRSMMIQNYFAQKGIHLDENMSRDDCYRQIIIHGKDEILDKCFQRFDLPFQKFLDLHSIFVNADPKAIEKFFERFPSAKYDDLFNLVDFFTNEKPGVVTFLLEYFDKDSLQDFAERNDDIPHRDLLTLTEFLQQKDKDGKMKFSEINHMEYIKFANENYNIGESSTSSFSNTLEHHSSREEKFSTERFQRLSNFLSYLHTNGLSSLLRGDMTIDSLLQWERVFSDAKVERIHSLHEKCFTLDEIVYCGPYLKSDSSGASFIHRLLCNYQKDLSADAIHHLKLLFSRGDCDIVEYLFSREQYRSATLEDLKYMRALFLFSEKNESKTQKNLIKME